MLEECLQGFGVALLRAMGEKHIPGIPANLRILLLGQSGEDDGGSGEGETALENVVRSDDRRERAMKDAAGWLSLVGGEEALT